MKKRNALTAVVLAISSVLPAFSYDARAIRKDLKAKYAHNLINKSQLAEDGVSLLEVLDRDIQIMEKDKERLQRAMDDHKGIIERSIVPFFKKVGTAVTGGLSATTGLLALGGSSWLLEHWTGERNYGIKATDAIVKKGAFFGLNQKDVDRYNQNKFDFLINTVQGFKESVVLVPIFAVTSIVSGYLFMKMARSAWNHHAQLDAKIAKWKASIDRNDAIIAQLKDLKWAETH